MTVTRGRSVAEVLAAACLFATTGTARALGVPHASPVGVGAGRLIVGGVGLLVVARLSGVAIRPRRPWLIAVSALLVAVFQLAFFAGLDRAGVAVGTVVTIGSGPPLAGLIALLAGQGRPSRRGVGATAGAVVGIIVLTNPTTSSVDPAGVGLALLSGLGYAGYTVSTKAAVADGEASLAVMASSFGLAGALLIPAFLLAGPGWVGHPSGVLTALYLGIFPTVVAYLLFGRALRTLPAATITTLILAEPVIASGLGVFVLGERPGAGAVIGAGLVLAGLLLVATDRVRSVP
jgi:DME family drug/metabolite transporter